MTTRTRAVVITAASAIAVAAIAITTYLLARPGEFSGYGAVTVNTTSSIVGRVSDGVLYAENTDCEGVDGYSDLAIGSRVSVADSGGEIVALGVISDGNAKTGVGPSGCVLEFIVRDIPEDAGPYQVTVGHRDPIVVGEDELRAGVEFSIG